ncbi:MAG: leucine-rich repeat domain-containing protein, partial [Muribaculaceae bacterium]|nr:leucine-rich repeat domain-containing protein [Muribaculaceae bacterium]
MKRNKSFIITVLAMLFCYCSLSAFVSKHQYVRIDQAGYYLNPNGKAKIAYVQETDVMAVPSTIEYEGETYSVDTIGAYLTSDIRSKLIIPNTIKVIEPRGIGSLDSLIIEDGDIPIKVLCDSGVTTDRFSDHVTEWSVYSFVGDFNYVYYGRFANLKHNAGVVHYIYGYQDTYAVYSTINKIDIGPLVSSTYGANIYANEINVLKRENSLSINDIIYCHTLNIDGNISNTSSLRISELNFGPNVTSIPNNFFRSIGGFKTLRISKSLKYFDPSDLVRQENLTTLEIEEGNPICTFENGFLYNSEKSVLYLYLPNYMTSTYELVLPSTLTYINSWVFQNTQFTKIIAPSLTDIGARAFYNSKLTELIIDGNLKTVGADAFRKCKISSLKLGDNITEISDRAFYDCENLKIDDEVFP